MPDFLISSGKNVADFPYLFQKLRFRISHLLLERVFCFPFYTVEEIVTILYIKRKVSSFLTLP